MEGSGKSIWEREIVSIPWLRPVGRVVGKAGGLLYSGLFAAVGVVGFCRGWFEYASGILHLGAVGPWLFLVWHLGAAAVIAYGVLSLRYHRLLAVWVVANAVSMASITQPHPDRDPGDKAALVWAWLVLAAVSVVGMAVGAWIDRRRENRGRFESRGVKRSSG